MINLKKNITFGRVQEETFIINAETGRALKFDQQGTLIWNMVYHGNSKQDIKGHFERLFPSAKEAIYRDIDTFFSVLEQENII